MYSRIKAIISVTLNSSILRSYVTKNRLDQDTKKELALNAIRLIYTGYVHKNLGAFVSVSQNEFKVLELKIPDASCFTVKTLATLYFYKINLKEICDLKILEITDTHILGAKYGYKIIIPTDQLSTVKPVYNPASKVMQVGDKKLKVQDLIRIRITSIHLKTEVGSTRKIFFVYGSCKNNGLGKL